MDAKAVRLDLLSEGMIDRSLDELDGLA